MKLMIYDIYIYLSYIMNFIQFSYMIGNGHFRLIPEICLFQEVSYNNMIKMTQLQGQKRWPQVRRSRPQNAPRVATPTVTTTVLRRSWKICCPLPRPGELSGGWMMLVTFGYNTYYIYIHITQIYIYTYICNMF